MIALRTAKSFLWLLYQLLNMAKEKKVKQPAGNLQKIITEGKLHHLLSQCAMALFHSLLTLL